jgi:hypothetical protein
MTIPMYAQRSHGSAWQVKGRKLFVCFAPSDTKHLYQMETEVETSQSPIDPLQPDVTQVGVRDALRCRLGSGLRLRAKA